MSRIRTVSKTEWKIKNKIANIAKAIDNVSTIVIFENIIESKIYVRKYPEADAKDLQHPMGIKQWR